jgi:hypothetical protein
MEETPKRKQLLISCGMLSDELKTAYQKCNADCKIIWMKRALHNHPQSLKESLLTMINEHQDQDDIMLTYGLCGNGTLGIKSPDTRLIIPRFHDCIHQIIQSVDNYTVGNGEQWKIDETLKNKQKQTMAGHLYLTRSWTLDQEAMLQQSQAIIKKYGEHQGQEILNEMYGSYTDIDVIDTGAYDVGPVFQYALDAANINNLNENQLKVNQIKGSTLILEKMLRGEWDVDFIVLEPGEELTQNHFFNI